VGSSPEEEGGAKGRGALLRRLYRGLIEPREEELKSLVLRAAPEQSMAWRGLRRFRNHLRETSGPQPRNADIALEQRAFGVNVSGNLHSEKGVGEGVRGMARAVRQAGVPFVLNDFPDIYDAANREQLPEQSVLENPYLFNYVHVNADQVPTFAREMGGSYFHGHYNIGYWAWELSEFPEEWLPSFSYFDEIWTPTRFVQDSVAKLAPIPVVRMPHALSTERVEQQVGREHFGLPRDHTVFLFAFDACSYLERKNPLGLIRAFRKAFRPDEPATLLLKCAHAEFAPESFAELRRAAEEARVRVIDVVYSRQEMNQLMTLCDAYVSLHRSEGFGLTLAEAMMLGRPVIATGYSGNLDFMTESTGMLVRHREIEIQKEVGPYAAGSRWADPDLDHAAALMRRVYEHPEWAASIGRAARTHVDAQLSPQAVGTRIEERLGQLAAARGIAAPSNRSRRRWRSLRLAAPG
jgi:glycosyltransferase involved in cell wall biosynthesis